MRGWVPVFLLACRWERHAGMGSDVVGMRSDYALREWKIPLYHLTRYRIYPVFLPSQMVIGLKSSQS